MTPDVLPDLLKPGLRLVFCGMAAGPESARIGAYYAGPGNRFWTALHQAGFTPEVLRPAAFARLGEWGIGLTDLAKTQHGVDRRITVSDADVARFSDAMMRFSPHGIAFTSRETATRFLRHRAGKKLAFGPLSENLRPAGFPPAWVLPSTSRLNGHWQKRDFQRIWCEAAIALGFGGG